MQEDDYGLMDGHNLGLDGIEHTLLVLADGMGGHDAGEVASRLVTNTVIDTYQGECGPISDRLFNSVDSANNKLAEVSAKYDRRVEMGSTVIAAVVTEKGLEWISVGDSLMWLFRDGSLYRLNADHSMAPILENLVEAGHMDAEEAATDPKRHMLRSAVAGKDISLVDQSSQPVAIRVDDILILASDGLETLSETEIVAVLNRHHGEPLEKISDRLVAEVKGKGKSGQDNTTIILYRPEGNYGRHAPAPNLSGESHTTIINGKEGGAGHGSDFSMKLSAILIKGTGSYIYYLLIALFVIALFGYFWFDESELPDSEPIANTESGTEKPQTSEPPVAEAIEEVVESVDSQPSPAKISEDFE